MQLCIVKFQIPCVKISDEDPNSFKLNPNPESKSKSRPNLKKTHFRLIDNFTHIYEKKKRLFLLPSDYWLAFKLFRHKHV